MALFRDAHQYFFCVSKNVESYSEVASELDDSEFLTDAELFNEFQILLSDQYAGAQLHSLSPAQKLDIAKILHFKYRSSNGQIRRIIGISPHDVDQLFGRRNQ